MSARTKPGSQSDSDQCAKNSINDQRAGLGSTQPALGPSIIPVALDDEDHRCAPAVPAGAGAAPTATRNSEMSTTSQCSARRPSRSRWMSTPWTVTLFPVGEKPNHSPTCVAAVAPHDGDLVALGDQMLDRERGVERRPDHADALLEALHSLRLSGERVVLDVVRPRDLVQDLQPALVADLLVEPPNDPLVLVLLLRHRGPPPARDPFGAGVCRRHTRSCVPAHRGAMKLTHRQLTDLSHTEAVRDGGPVTDETLGVALKKLRAAAGMTQEELADRAGISARTVSDVERGLRTVVHGDTARRLAAALGLSERGTREVRRRRPRRGGEHAAARRSAGTADPAPRPIT